MTDELNTDNESEEVIETSDEDTGNPVDNGTEESHPTETPDAASDKADPEQDKVKALERKIARDAWQQRESKRRVKQLEAELQRRQEQRTPTKQPKLDEFETFESYLDARDEWVRENSQPRAEAPKASAEPDVDPEVLMQMEDLFFEGEEKYDDFTTLVAGDVPITDNMRDAILGIDDISAQVEVSYFLARNPREAAKISRMQPSRQAAEIGKLEFKLTESTVVTKRPSKAPAPIKPVQGGGRETAEIQDTEDFESFLKKRNKQLGRK